MKSDQTNIYMYKVFEINKHMSLVLSVYTIVFVYVVVVTKTRNLLARRPCVAGRASRQLAAAV